MKSAQALHILVICTGNVCRSPIAEAMLNKMLSARECFVSSAGLASPSNVPPHEFAIRSALSLGFLIDPGKRSHQVCREDVADADVVLGMTRSHIRQVGVLQPVSTGKVYLLGHWSGSREIEDPIGGDEALFDRIAYEIKIECERWAERLRRVRSINQGHS